MRALVTVKSAVGLGNGALSIYPLLAASLGAGAVGTGLLFAVRGMGLLFGPLLLNRWLAGGGRLMPGLAVSMAVFGLSYVGVSFTSVFLLVLVFVFVASAAASSNFALSTCALQEEVPDELRGRVIAADIMLSAFAVALSQLLVGALVGVVDIRILLAACGTTTLLYAVCWRLATVVRPGRASGTGRRCVG
jgi:MFS family permease